MLAMHFCPLCGSTVSVAVPPGDNRERHVCTGCGEIHYQNPKNVVGCLLEWEGQILLCKRSIEPRYGYWTLPAGFMENGETTLHGAAREAHEEACAEADNLQLLAVYSLPTISQVYLMYKGILRNGFHQAGEESLDTALYNADDIPWEELAFPVVAETLKRYLQDGQPDGMVYHADIYRRENRQIEFVRHN